MITTQEIYYKEKKNMSEKICNENLPFLDDKYSFNESVFI
jgi:hypothetical protein